MPIYEYYCQKCQRKFELLKPISKAGDEAECPVCHSSAKRAISKFISRSQTDFSYLQHMMDANSSSGSSCSTCSSGDCSSCGK
jgi:putative FmdB family regulatory protein